jgi:hypothetical protein
MTSVIHFSYSRNFRFLRNTDLYNWILRRDSLAHIILFSPVPLSPILTLLPCLGDSQLVEYKQVLQRKLCVYIYIYIYIYIPLHELTASVV